MMVNLEKFRQSKQPPEIPQNRHMNFYEQLVIAKSVIAPIKIFKLVCFDN